MNTLNIKLYDTLRKELNLDEQKSRAITLAIEEALNTENPDVATKDFVKKEIAESKNDLIKWMFAFWIGQIAVIAGILMYFLKK